VSRVLIHNDKYQAVNILLSGMFMAIVAPPRRRYRPDNKLLIYKELLSTLIQDTGYFAIRGNIQFSYIRVAELCVRENVRLYNWEGFVTFLY
jgi:hypothetical protein